MRRRTWTVIVASIGLGCGAWFTLAGEPAASQPQEKNARVKQTSVGGRESNTAAISGREIFLREWLPNDPRSHGGDGLGPVFNESSCVACHNQGGVGGAGSEGKNVTIISAVRVPPKEQIQAFQQAAVPREESEPVTADDPVQAPRATESGAGPQSLTEQIGSAVLQALQAVKQPNAVVPKQPPVSEAERKTMLAALKELHPGLAQSRSVVLHRSSNDLNYSEWRQRLMLGEMMFEQMNQFSGSGLLSKNQADNGQLGLLIAQVLLQGVPQPRDMALEKFASMIDTLMSHPTLRGQLGIGAFMGEKTPPFVVQVSQRNATALFGAGLIDSIPDAVLEAAAEKDNPDYPQATGRVARLKDGKIGRFGWKSQKASLYDFTMTACAVELGLHVPDHPQAGSPHRPDYQPTGFDLNQQECNALVKFLKDLPAPDIHATDNAALRDSMRTGERLFAKVGCAACHTPQLGEVAGIYSDLLLHDMGPDSGDSGSYGVFVPDSTASDSEDPIPELTAVPSFGDGRLRTASAQTLQMVPDDLKGAASQEWRTPPLWGVRDSAPYLHDGRAKTLEQAIAMHGGEGHQAAVKYFHLSKPDQTRLLSFLRTLVAPDAIVATK